MNTGMHIGDFFARVRKKTDAIAKAVNPLFGKQKRTGNDAEQWVEEFEHLSGHGHSDGWRFDRDEIHRRR
jgi:hypothetical protein